MTVFDCETMKNVSFFAGIPCITAAIALFLFIFLLHELCLSEVSFIQLASQRNEDIFSSLYKGLIITHFKYPAVSFQRRHQLPVSGHSFPFQVNRIAKSHL